MRTHAVKTNIAMIRWLLYCCWANASWHITANNFIVTKRWKGERKKKGKTKKNLNEFSVKDRKKREKTLLKWDGYVDDSLIHSCKKSFFNHIHFQTVQLLVQLERSEDKLKIQHRLFICTQHKLTYRLTWTLHILSKLSLTTSRSVNDNPPFTVRSYNSFFITA